MKKFMKGCGITAIIFLVSGIVLAAVAGTVRGSTVIGQVVEKATRGRVHANLLWGNGNWGIFWDEDDWDMFGGFNDAYEIFGGDTLMRLNTHFAAEDIQDLNIQVGGCEFKTKVSDTGDFYVKAQGIGKVQFYEERGVLHVNSVNSRRGLNAVTGISWTGEITLYVPEGHTFDEVNIELGAGKLTFDNLSAEDVSLEVGAGQLLVRNLQAEEVKASVGMGQMELKEIDVRVLEAEVGMGELVADGNIEKKGNLECAMGNLELRLEGSEKDFNYRLEAAAGNIDLGRSSYSGLGMERSIDNNASKDLSIECAMGNIDIRFDN